MLPPVRRERTLTATVIADIDARGRIVHVAVETSSGYDVLDAAALEAVRQWRAAPAIRGGRAVASTERQPIIFRPRR